jgi:hypothetical protein
MAATTPVARTNKAPRIVGHHGGVAVPHLDDATRPRRYVANHAPITPTGQVGADALVAVHDNLRAEMRQVLDVIDQVVAGTADPHAARSLVNRMTMRQNYWSVGAFCASYCRILTLHHTIEDQRLFRDLRSHDEGLGPVLDRLSEEHEVIAGVLDRVDRSLVAMLADPSTVGEVRREAVLLSEVLLSHLAYEEEQLVDPLRSSTIEI